MRVLRYDVGEVTGVERLDNGFLRVDARITRTGVFEYRRADGTIQRELRSADEVFNADSLATLDLLPLTNDHPAEPVTSRNAGKFQVGTVTQPKRDGDFVAARIQITDQKAIDEAEGGKRQLSVGYNVDLEKRAGVTSGVPGVPDGLRFDAIQTNIRGNHVALLDKGKAGPEASLRLDGDDAIQIGQTQKPGGDPPPIKDPVMLKIKHDGVDIEVTEAGAQVIATLRARLDTADEAKTAAAKDLSTEKARADKAEEDLTAEKKAREDSDDPKALEAKVRKRIGLESKATEILGDDFKVDGVTDAEIKSEIVIKLARDPKVAKERLDSNDDAAYLDARYDAAIDDFDPEAGKKGVGNLRRLDVDVSERNDVDEARAKMIKRNANAWQGETAEAK
jgi:hypothetical protein